MSCRDVFAMLPTGGGKSLCYQLPGMIGNGITFVVMPLLSLIQDQFDFLDKLGIPARIFSGSLTSEQNREVYEAW